MFYQQATSYVGRVSSFWCLIHFKILISDGVLILGHSIGANSEDPDQTAPSKEQSDQGLHCSHHSFRYLLTHFHISVFKLLDYYGVVCSNI